MRRISSVFALLAALIFIGPPSASGLDISIPVLSQLSVSSTGVRPGDRVSFAYEASDEQGSLGQIDLR
ncbi:hypothetical protein ACXR8F_04020, partial [Terrabacter sp. AAH1]